MVAVPTFIAPFGDLLTGDRVRSSRDSQLASGDKPLWAVAFDFGGVDGPHLLELSPVDLGIVLHRINLRTAPGLPSRFQYVGSVGGTRNTLWLSTFGGAPDVEHRIYDVDPRDMSVRQSRRFPRQGVPVDDNSGGFVGGDNDTLWAFQVHPLARRLYKLRASDLAVTDTLSVTMPIRGIGGDSSGVWAIGDWGFSGQSGFRLFRISADMEVVLDMRAPFYIPGGNATPRSVAGDDRYLYLYVFSRPGGVFRQDLRILDAQQLPIVQVLQTYGDFESIEGGLRDMGGW